MHGSVRYPAPLLPLQDQAHRCQWAGIVRNEGHLICSILLGVVNSPTTDPYYTLYLPKAHVPCLFYTNLVKGFLRVTCGTMEKQGHFQLAKSPSLVKSQQTKFASVTIPVNEQLRMKHWYLVLRRPQMQNNIRFRSKRVADNRRYLTDNGFLDIETPTLFRRTPG